MLYRRLGKSGLQISEFSLGSWVTFNKQVQESDALKLMLHYKVKAQVGFG